MLATVNVKVSTQSIRLGSIGPSRVDLVGDVSCVGSEIDNRSDFVVW